MKNVCELCQLYSPSGCAKLSSESCLKDALQLISDTATVGDIAMAVFPEIVVEEPEYGIAKQFVQISTSKTTHMGIEKEHWNASYNHRNDEVPK